ncbi:hypothetical protein DENSPDRAFT_887268 [Dentipellis sp. KUC8613]|nr:hypothetical protein DENSPDRAFT_887268 [Dentipellis sp. KUC8613]
MHPHGPPPEDSCSQAETKARRKQSRGGSARRGHDSGLSSPARSLSDARTRHLAGLPTFSPQRAPSRAHTLARVPVVPFTPCRAPYAVLRPSPPPSLSHSPPLSPAPLRAAPAPRSRAAAGPDWPSRAPWGRVAPWGVVFAPAPPSSYLPHHLCAAPCRLNPYSTVSRRATPSRASPRATLSSVSCLTPSLRRHAPCAPLARGTPTTIIAPVLRRSLAPSRAPPRSSRHTARSSRHVGCLALSPAHY